MAKMFREAPPMVGRPRWKVDDPHVAGVGVPAWSGTYSENVTGVAYCLAPPGGVTIRAAALAPRTS